MILFGFEAPRACLPVDDVTVTQLKPLCASVSRANLKVDGSVSGASPACPLTIPPRICMPLEGSETAVAARFSPRQVRSHIAEFDVLGSKNAITDRT